MSLAISHNERQMGNYVWRDYDIAIKRLQCLKIDEYKGISFPETPFSNTDPPLLACKFAESPGFEHIAALANEYGKIAIQDTTDTSNNGNNQLDGTVAHFNAIFDLAWKTDEMKLVTASGDHTVKLWNIDGSDIREERSFTGHTRSVKTVVFRKDDSSVFASGGRDGIICVWDIRAVQNMLNINGKPDSVIDCSCGPHTPTSSSKHKKRSYTRNCCSRVNSITGLAYQDDMTLISCTAGDGIIKVWDMRKNYTIHNRDPLPKYSIPYAGTTSRHGYTNLTINKNANKLYASCLDNIIYCFNISTYSQNPVMTYDGHHVQNSFYVKSSLSPDDLYLISGSSDEKAYIWNIKESLPLLTLNGHEAEVTCVAWCQRGETKIITCSDDSKHKIWRIQNVCDQNTCEEKDSVRGTVEIFDKTNLNPIKYSLDTTPYSSRRRRTSQTPSSEHPSSKRIKLECTKNKPGYTFCFCEDCNSTVSSRKRPQELNSPDGCGPAKRVRRLFSPNKRELKECDHDFKSLATILEENTVDISVSKLTILNDSEPSSSNVSKKEQTLSIIENLPNYVLDGTAPHLRIISPQKKKESKDWISQYRKEKEIRKRMVDETLECKTPKQLRLDIENCSPKVTPRRNLNHTPTRAHSPLLKYFKVTVNVTNKNNDTQCSSTIQQ